MLKRIFIGLLIFAGIIVLAGAVLFIWIRGSAPKTDKEFLSQLKGEIVFTRDENGHYEILKYNFQDQSITKIHQCDGICDHPKWSEDGEKIIFYKPKRDGTDDIYQLTPMGADLQLIDNRKLSIEDKYPQVKNIKIKSGDLFVIENGQEKLIYDAKYDGKFNTGVSRVSWSPDEKYLIFIDNRYTIFIADTNGRTTKLTNGEAFDWKY